MTGAGERDARLQLLLARPCENLKWGRCGYCYTCRLAQDIALRAALAAGAGPDGEVQATLALAERLEKQAQRAARVSAREEPPSRDKFAALRLLGPNWDSYGGNPISEKAIEAARNFLDWSPTGYVNVVPCSDGGVQLEWHYHRRDVEVKFGPVGTVEEVFAANVDSGAPSGASRAEALRAHIAELEAALAPFAKLADYWKEADAGTMMHTERVMVDVEAPMRARAALPNLPGKSPDRKGP